MVLTWLLGSTLAMAQEAPTAGESDAASEEVPLTKEERDARMAQARELYRLGAGLYKAGRYQEAIVSFSEAYTLSDNKKLLFNMANAQERLGDLEGAVSSLKEYRAHAPSGDRVSLDLRISSLEDRLATVPVAPAPAAPAPAPAPVTAATTAAMPVETALMPDPEPAKRGGPRWGLVGTGVVMAGGFGALSGWSYSQGRAQQESGDQDAYATSRTLNNVAIPLAGIGGGLAVLGLVLPSKGAATVTAAPNGARLHLRF